MAKASAFYFLLTLFMASFYGCESDEFSPLPPLVVYVSADEYVARPVLDAFSKGTGIPVHMVGDTEASKTTGLVDRIRSERDQPLAHVFWSSEAFLTIQLAEEGLLQPCHSVPTEQWFPEWRDPAGRWFGFSPRPRVLVYDPNRLADQEVPLSLEMLGQPRWQNQIVIADPRFGTTGGHLSALKVWYDKQGRPEGYQDFLEALASNQARILPGGNAAVVDEVRYGRALLGLTDADDVRAANRLGAGLAMRYVGPVEGVGTFMMPNTVAIVEGSGHPAAADFVDWLISADVARQLAESTSGNVPLYPSVAKDYPELEVPHPMSVDLNWAAMDYESAVRMAVSSLQD